MRLRVLLTNGARTVDLIWLRHTGADIYYGWVGQAAKDSYHADGKRHMKTARGELHKIEQHLRLDDFKGQLQLCAFGFGKGIVDSTDATTYTGKKGDSVIWLDARTLPNQVNVSLGLLEVGAYNQILPVHELFDLRLLHLVTNTVPWIYVTVSDITPTPVLGALLASQAADGR